MEGASLSLDKSRSSQPTPVTQHFSLQAVYVCECVCVSVVASQSCRSNEVCCVTNRKVDVKRATLLNLLWEKSGDVYQSLFGYLLCWCLFLPLVSGKIVHVRERDNNFVSTFFKIRYQVFLNSQHFCVFFPNDFSHY